MAKVCLKMPRGGTRGDVKLHKVLGCLSRGGSRDDFKLHKVPDVGANKRSS